MFKKFLDSNTIHLYSTKSHLKAVFVESFNRTLLSLLMKPIVLNGDGNWVELLPDLLKIYNNKFHTTFKMLPTQASKNPESATYEIESNPKKKARLKVGDYVRNAD